MTTARQQLDDARLYLCTDARTERGDLAAFADAALGGGVDVIQLRDKGIEPARSWPRSPCSPRRAAGTAGCSR